jgi:hypothetical protein
MNGIFIADEVNAGNFFAFFQRAFHAGDDNTTTVIAAHDVHCDSHVEKF